MKAAQLEQRFRLDFNWDEYRRRICGMEVIIHCHHYNARIQRTVESADAVDGVGIFVSSAEAVFATQIQKAIEGVEDTGLCWQIAAALYAHLGYGTLDVSRVLDGEVTVPHSHFVEGWRAGMSKSDRPVCSLTRGFLQAASAVIENKSVDVRELSCQIQGGHECKFEFDGSRSSACSSYDKHSVSHAHTPIEDPCCSQNVDEAAIIKAVAEMPIYGNEFGLIPAFNVYLASTPADFYNLVSIRFVNEMFKAGLGDIARHQLVADAENCAMNTFRGVMSSAEWDALVAPMVHDTTDQLFGVLAVSNALGWGNWSVTALNAEESLELATNNGYESMGYAELQGSSEQPQCLMLTGVSAGIMELIYGDGPIEDRFGQYEALEIDCRTATGACCRFRVEETL